MTAPRVVVTTAMVRDFIETFDPRDSTDQRIATRLRERMHGELYRREREHYPESIDLGGEG